MNEELLKPIVLKINRAESQIAEIFSMLSKSIAEKKIEFSCKVSEDKMGYEFFTNDYSDDNFLEEIGVRIGEVIHNLRTALDNLIFSTARSICDPPLKPNKLYFPVFEDENDFHHKTKDIFNQLPESVKNIVTQAQPFFQSKNVENFDTRNYFLTIIHWLNNIDKHRSPKVLLAILREIKFNGSIEFDNKDYTNFIDEKNGFFEFFPVKPNSKVFEFRTTERIENMNMNFGLEVQVELEVFEQNMKLEVLNQLHFGTVHLIIHYLKKLDVKIEFDKI